MEGEGVLGIGMIENEDMNGKLTILLETGRRIEIMKTVGYFL